ncbi:hypothetical protein PPERSA_11375 [Pseudocohnilembus persalinus]|uniref:Uncharacterized protein n=1 Tax=Pseudocohnilembus persalinus TaxID=266149 RepID=A0A0V0QPQ2_PSEPJ|nr:hypothetical protein PPERSA_11375 [Pseudocohnilembus persalinus]|eukprot:KRX04251.1 hypothetical protein PPERSA_11375 [Pseudocohnilembus persalinus]
MENKSFAGRPKPNNYSFSQQQKEDIFRKSGGFGAQNPMRISGTSFRPSSSKGKSGNYHLNFVQNFDELAYATQIKMDIIQLQDEIDNLDMDGKLRGGSVEFGSAPNTAMRKWLAQNSQNGKKELEKKLSQNLDEKQLLETLKVSSAEEGMKKLYKIAAIMDVMINKIHEYDIIYLLRYDETYNTLMKNASSSNNTKFNMLSQGVDTKKFLPAQANLERLVDMFALCAKQNQDRMSSTGGFSSIGLDKGPKFTAEGIKNRDDMIRYLDRLPNKIMEKEFKDVIIDQLKEANELEQKLKVALAFNESSNDKTSSSQGTKGPNYEKQVKQLMAQMREIEEDKNQVYQRIEAQIGIIESLKKDIAERDVQIANLKQNQNQLPEQTKAQSQSGNQQLQINQKPPLYKDNPEYWERLIEDTEQQFEQRQRDIKEELESLKEKLIQKNVQIEKLTSQLTESFQRDQDFKAWKTEYFREFQKSFKNSQEQQSSYEQALLTEFERYKKAWERRISDLEYEVENSKKNNSRQIVDLKNKLKRAEESKGLLLKKLQCYIQC